MKYTPWPYQQFAEDHITDQPEAGLFMEMGLGKTVVTLTAIHRLIYDLFEVTKVLVIAPKRVAEDTWTTEADKWDHLQGLKISRVLGTERQRVEALRAKADIYVINRENVAWLVSHLGGAWPFDMVVVDESSSFKSAKSTRFKALRTIRPRVKRVVILTGTPRPNGLIDLWPQVYLLDMGQRLGKTISQYREQYFIPGKRNGHVVYNYNLKQEKDELIGIDYYEKLVYERIGDICISMRAKDYLTLPQRITRTVPVRFNTKVVQMYEQFEREQVLALDEEEISAVNAAALCTKLSQFANGAVYREDGTYYEVHDEKLEELEEILDAADGQPVMVFYWFKHDLERIKRKFKAYDPQELSGPADIRKWNAGGTKLLLLHPASAGHGLNLQAGGNIIVWFGPIWSLELYQQANARLDRQGQLKAVIVHHLVAQGTIDQEIMESLEGKAQGQDAMMFAVKARIEKWKRAEQPAYGDTLKRKIA